MSRGLWDNRDTMSGTIDQRRDATNAHATGETPPDARDEPRGDKQFATRLADD